MSKLFNKVSQGAGKLYNKAMGDNGIFRKLNVGMRKADNTVARVGHFIRPIANHFGMGGLVQNAVNKVHGYQVAATKHVTDIKNNLEKSVNNPMSQIHTSNYA